MTSFRWGTATDAGRVRDGNEDFALAVDGLFVVADGMGGHQAGETASHVAVETVRAHFTPGSAAGSSDGGVEGGDGPDEQGSPSGAYGLVRAVEQANQEILRQADADEDLEGMGTTLCALAVAPGEGRDQLAVVNVGDSRLYLLSDGELRQVTEDHSLVATLQRQGRLTQSEAAVHPQRNILTRALGIEPHVMVDSWELEARAGDRYLLCTDGLFNEVDDGRMASTLRKISDPTEVARELVRLANESGGRDNITAVVVDVLGAADVSAPPDVPSPPEAAIPPDGGDPEGDAPAEAAVRRRRFTWRVAVFLLALLAIVGSAIGIIAYGLSTEDSPPPTTTTTTSSTTTTIAVVEPPAPPPPLDQPGAAPGAP